MRKAVLIAVLFFPVLVFADANTKIDSFSKAKRLLMKKVYHDHRITFYCGCPFNEAKKIIESSDFTASNKYKKRAKRVEWEHVVPAEAFGQSFPEWRNGHSDCIDRKGRAFKGRNCAGKVNQQYRYMQSDMYNLVPANGQINALRSNYSFAMIPGEARNFGACDMEIEKRKAEPRKEIRGDIARIYFYMDWAYPERGIISKKNRKLFKAWADGDPVDDWERERGKRIERIQGNKNPFVD